MNSGETPVEGLGPDGHERPGRQLPGPRARSHDAVGPDGPERAAAAGAWERTDVTDVENYAVLGED
jgi:hypothetical protein